LSWLAAEPSFGKMLAVELWLSFIYASYNGAMIVALTEVMPVGVRTSGFSLAYSLATTFGGFTAAICTWLIATTGDNASPGWWMSAAAVCGLLGTVLVYRTQAVAPSSEVTPGLKTIGT
jgi:MHS family citrate/tricarballylate:H+ symporter-like MFS transporter